MSIKTTQNFWEAMALPMPIPLPVFYRLYYDDEGNPLYYSMEDLPGNYIEIDQATYAASSSKVQVRNNTLYKIEYVNTIRKLHPGVTGTPCHPTDVSIVVPESHPHIKWSIKKIE